MDRIRVLVVDDNIAFRNIIREVVGMENDMEVCGEADSLNQAKNILLEKKPDIVLLDISMDGYEGGLRFLEEMAKTSSADFIILSAHDEMHYSGKSLEAGAKGYVSKGKTVQCLAEAIRSVRSGREFVSSHI